MKLKLKRKAQNNNNNKINGRAPNQKKTQTRKIGIKGQHQWRSRSYQLMLNGPHKAVILPEKHGGERQVLTQSPFRLAQVKHAVEFVVPHASFPRAQQWPIPESQACRHELAPPLRWRAKQKRLVTRRWPKVRAILLYSRWTRSRRSANVAILKGRACKQEI